jgi:transposase-like protein
LRLPREERAEVVASLRESGLSIRAIESATGHSKDTIRKDLYQIGTPADPEPLDVDADELAEELIAAEPPGAPTESTPGQTSRVAEALRRAHATEQPGPVIGLDGKRYQPETRCVRSRIRNLLRRDVSR